MAFGGLESLVLAPWVLVVAAALTLFAGTVKGALGFAMPMILISTFPSIMSVEMALAALILPTLITNLSQAFRQGVAEAWGSVRKYWRMMTAIAVFLVISAQMLPFMPERLMLGLLGGPIVAFALVQLMGIPLRIRVERRRRAEWGLGMIGGLYGGVSGVWGPPLIVYLLSTGAEPREMVRVQGVVFLMGAVVLVFAHLQSGVLNAASVPVSALLVVPAMIGMWIGYFIQDRLDAARFRRWTLVMLVLTGLNLLRLAVFG
ncbi:MAG: sulfite exporter TauE/SafE family protein [Rhodobacteraceae bacterium]|nr:sulfite exporter TauE/SafE family protein [Paracoccaceae bacterium]